MVVLTKLGPPSSGIRMERKDVKVYVNSAESSIGNGTLYISDARLTWIVDTKSEDNSKMSRDQLYSGFSLEYPHIACHAVQRDTSHFPYPNLYLIVDVKLVESENSSLNSFDDCEDEGGVSDGDCDDSGITELHFVPCPSSSAGNWSQDVMCNESLKNDLETMFETMSKCQALHPDKGDSEGDDSAEDFEDIAQEEYFEDRGYDDIEEDEEATPTTTVVNGVAHACNGLADKLDHITIDDKVAGVVEKNCSNVANMKDD